MTLMHHWLSCVARFITQPSHARRVVFTAVFAGVIILLRMIGLPN